MYGQLKFVRLFKINFYIFMNSVLFLADFIKVCHRNDPKISNCVKNSVHNLRQYLKNGIEDLNVPSLEPLYIGELNILEGGSSGLMVKTNNLNIWGASNFEIKKIR